MGKKLFELMNSKEYYGEELREGALVLCARRTCQKGKTARAFMIRWDNAKRKVRARGVEFLGFLMARRLN